MTVLKRFKKKLRLVYISVCIVGLFFYLTGYSFSFDFLDYSMVAIILLYPIVKFIQAPTPLWIKISITLLIIAPIILLADDILLIIAFGSESKRKVQEWKVDGHEIILTERQGWAGPPYERYDLVKYKALGLVNKTIAYGYPERDSTGTASCKVLFESESYDNSYRYEFDRCIKMLKKN
jgi:hypothetical protein